MSSKTGFSERTSRVLVESRRTLTALTLACALASLGADAPTVPLGSIKHLALVTQRDSMTVGVIDLESRAEAGVLRLELPPTSLDVRPDGSEIWVGLEIPSGIAVIRTDDNRVRYVPHIQVTQAASLSLANLRFSPGGQELYVVANARRSVVALDPDGPRFLYEIPIGLPMALAEGVDWVPQRQMAVSPDGRWLAVAVIPGGVFRPGPPMPLELAGTWLILVLDLDARAIAHRIPIGRAFPTHLLFSPRAEWLFVVCEEGPESNPLILVAESVSGAVLRQVPVPFGGVTSVASDGAATLYMGFVDEERFGVFTFDTALHAFSQDYIGLDVVPYSLGMVPEAQELYVLAAPSRASPAAGRELLVVDLLEQRIAERAHLPTMTGADLFVSSAESSPERR